MEGCVILILTHLTNQIPGFLDLDGVGGLVVEGHHRVARLVVQDGDLVLQGRNSIALSRIEDFCFYETPLDGKVIRMILRAIE